MTQHVGPWPQRPRIVGAALGVGWKQAEILMAIASGQFHSRICLDLKITAKCLMVHVSKLRRRGWDIPHRTAEVYSLSASDRSRVIDAMALIGRHVAHVGASRTGRGVTAPASFQPLDDASREQPDTFPSHSVTTSRLPHSSMEALGDVPKAGVDCVRRRT